MEDLDVAAAVTRARATVDAPDSVPAVTFRVRRLDRDSTYVLVQIGSPAQPGWVVAVDTDQGEVMTWAANPSGQSTVPTIPPSDIHAGETEWVWRPSRLSMSPLYPLLRIATDGEERFIDLAGSVSNTLPDARA